MLYYRFVRLRAIFSCTLTALASAMIPSGCGGQLQPPPPSALDERTPMRGTSLINESELNPSDSGAVLDDHRDDGEGPPDTRPFAGWVRAAGSPSGDWLADGALCPDGGIVLTGRFGDTVELNPTQDENPNVEPEAFVLKLDSDGRPLWARWFICDGSAVGQAIGAAPDGSVVIAGSFSGTIDLDPGPASAEQTAADETIFVVRMSSEGEFQWARAFGQGNATLNDIALAADGSVAMTGSFVGNVDFDPGRGVVRRSATSADDDTDIFVSSMSEEGELQWVRTLGGPREDSGEALAVGLDSSIILVGSFQSTVDFDPGPRVVTSEAASTIDMFVLKLDRRGRYGWVRTFGGSGEVYGRAVDVAETGAIVVGGRFYYGVDFDPGPGSDDHMYNGEHDAFVVVLGGAGEHRWAQTFGGPTGDEVIDVAIASDGSVVATGTFHGEVDFAPGDGVDQRSSNGSADLVVVAYGQQGEYRWAYQVGGLERDEPSGVFISQRNDAIVAGMFRGVVDFDSGPGVVQRTSEGEQDIFVLRLP